MKKSVRPPVELRVARRQTLFQETHPHTVQSVCFCILSVLLHVRREQEASLSVSLQPMKLRGPLSVAANSFGGSSALSQWGAEEGEPLHVEPNGAQNTENTGDTGKPQRGREAKTGRKEEKEYTRGTSENHEEMKH